MRLIKLLFVSFVLGAALGADGDSHTPGDSEVPEQADEQQLDFWMQKKLDYSGGILRGLSMGDFDVIETSANQMRVLNRIEGFVRSRHEGYRAHVRSFERVTEEIIRQAEQKNIDGVTLAYHQMVVSCVRCHQSIRETNPTDTLPATGAQK
ncbi:hypothetical protein [Aporhodopirellula aestuarii]|uniref:Secreted protein n=1 Tax=Aporhodopirellula aestuarii TaxID=2950107 RepID=A0ABT0TZA4_9BACT|nr:hypothetical protein [Aporhodopirellula aestuarii]MCM2369714.1 hypothetical protein [Aporhodopirellula aestuarii]